MTLWTKQSFQDLITVHPVKQPGSMLSVHHFYKSLDFQESYKNLRETADYLNRLCQLLPPDASPSLSASAGCDLKLHPHLEYFNASSKMNHRGLAPSGYLVHRQKVPFYLKPVDKFDVKFWTHFNDSLVQDMGAVSPEFSPHGSLVAEIRHLLGMLRPYIQTQFSPQEVDIKHILDGYTRFNPHFGREYILTLKLSVQGAFQYRRYHIVREIGPLVSVVDLPAVSPKQAVNVILPVEQADSLFVEFLKSFGHIGLKYKGNTLHLVVVVFSTSVAVAVEEVLKQFTADSFPLSVTIATGSGEFGSLRAFDIGMATLESDSSLAFLASPNLRFAPGFFRRCRSNSELGRRVYFPSAFWLYQTDYTEYSDGSEPPITSWTGQWSSYDYRMACIYKQDYDKVGGYRGRGYSVQLFEAVIAGHYDIMQAPEPGLFKVWEGKPCWRLGSSRRKKICSHLKKASEFEQSELADYLAELGAAEDNFIYQKQSLL